MTAKKPNKKESDEVFTFKLFLPVGPAGCGKSTFYKMLGAIYQATNKTVLPRVSPDDIRFRLLNSEVSKVYYDPQKELIVWQEVWRDIRGVCETDKSLYMDATNLTMSKRYELTVNVRSFLQAMYPHRVINLLVFMFWFDLPLLNVLEADSKRKRQVGGPVIAMQYTKLEFIKEWEYTRLAIFKAWSDIDLWIKDEWKRIA